jgi:hypothetical protein
MSFLHPSLIHLDVCSNIVVSQIQHILHIYLAIISLSSYGIILYYSCRYLVISRTIIVSSFSLSLIAVIVEI